MKQSYDDILAVAGDKTPTWWDENGTPRFCDFHPDHVPNIYCVVAALIVSRCQSCHKTFLVGLSQHEYMEDFYPEQYADDPPIHDCGGDTMTTDTLEVKEYWSRDNDNREWKRVHEKEITLEIEEE